MPVLDKLKGWSGGRHIDAHSLDYKQPHAKRTRRYNPVTQRFESVNSAESLECDRVQVDPHPLVWWGVMNGQVVTAQTMEIKRKVDILQAIRQGLTLSSADLKASGLRAVNPAKPVYHERCARCGKALSNDGDYEARRYGLFCTTECAEEANPFATVEPRFAKGVA